MEGLPQHLQQQHLRLLEGKTENQTPDNKPAVDETRQSTENLAFISRDKNDSKASLNRAATKQSLVSASSVNLQTVKTVRNTGSQQSLGDFTSIYAKVKTLEGDPNVVTIALTQPSNNGYLSKDKEQTLSSQQTLQTQHTQPAKVV